MHRPMQTLTVCSASTDGKHECDTVGTRERRFLDSRDTLRIGVDRRLFDGHCDCNRDPLEDSLLWPALVLGLLAAA